MNDKTTEAVSKCMINLQCTFSLWELEFIYMISDWRWNLICDITLKMTMTIIIKFKCCLAVFDIWYNCQLVPWQKWWYHLVHCICRYQHFPDKIFDIFFINSINSQIWRYGNINKFSWYHFFFFFLAMRTFVFRYSVLIVTS